MTLQEAQDAIKELKAQGNSEEDMLATFYAMFVDDVIDINELSDLCQLIGYEVTDEFKKLSPEEQKTKGYEEDDETEVTEKTDKDDNKDNEDKKKLDEDKKKAEEEEARKLFGF